MVVGSPIVLNLIPGGVMPVIMINETDKGYQKEFLIYNGNAPYNVPSNVSATIRGTKRDGYGVTEAADITAGSNVVRITVTEQMTAVPGKNIFELVFVDTNSLRVATANFIMLVERSALNANTVISDSDIAYSEQVLNQLQGVEAYYNKFENEKITRFATCTDMKASTAPKSGMICQTAGYYAVNDGGAALYYIMGSAPIDDYYETLQNGLIAVLIVGNSVSPEQFGAKGDGVTDDRSAFNTALSFCPNLCLTHGKVYLISTNNDIVTDAYAGVIGVDDMHLYGQGATLQIATSERSAYAGIFCRGLKNVVITNLTIIGDRDTHTGTEGEYGHGIVIRRCEDVLVDNCDISKCWGDGVLISYNTSSSPGITKDITIRSCHIYSCRRQGITVAHGENIIITECFIHDIDGTAPRSCIDFEPDAIGQYVRKCIVSDCVLENPNYTAIDVDTMNGCDYADIAVYNCEIYGRVLYQLKYGEHNLSLRDVSIKGIITLQPEAGTNGVLTASDISMIKLASSYAIAYELESTAFRAIFDNISIDCSLESNQATAVYSPILIMGVRQYNLTLNHIIISGGVIPYAIARENGNAIVDKTSAFTDVHCYSSALDALPIVQPIKKEVTLHGSMPLSDGNTVGIAAEYLYTNNANAGVYVGHSSSLSTSHGRKILRNQTADKWIHITPRTNATLLENGVKTSTYVTVNAEESVLIECDSENEIYNVIKI